MVFRLELEEAKKHKSNQMEYDALARIINKNKDRKTTQGKSQTVSNPRTKTVRSWTKTEKIPGPDQDQTNFEIQPYRSLDLAIRGSLDDL